MGYAHERYQKPILFFLPDEIDVSEVGKKIVFRFPRPFYIAYTAFLAQSDIIHQGVSPNPVPVMFKFEFDNPPSSLNSGFDAQGYPYPMTPSGSMIMSPYLTSAPYYIDGDLSIELVSPGVSGTVYLEIIAYEKFYRSEA